MVIKPFIFSLRVGFMKALVLLVVALSTIKASAETVIDVFSYTKISIVSIPGTQITLHDLSRTAAIESTAPEFPYDPSNPAPTVLATKTWMQSEAGQQWHKEMRDSFKPIEKMYQCGISKVPAIAFNKCRYVIYGLTDIKQAVQEYDDFIRKNGAPK